MLNSRRRKRKTFSLPSGNSVVLSLARFRNLLPSGHVVETEGKIIIFGTDFSGGAENGEEHCHFRAAQVFITPSEPSSALLTPSGSSWSPGSRSALVAMWR